MPKSWYSWIASKIEDGDSDEVIAKKELDRRLVVEKKPYFFKYIYPTDKKNLNEYVKNNNDKAVIQYKMSLKELEECENRTPEMDKFLEYYYSRFPLGTAPCTVNRICWRIENVFDGYKEKFVDEFNYDILKSNATYDYATYNKIENVYKDYKKRVKDYYAIAKADKIDDEVNAIEKLVMREEFIQECTSICPDPDKLCNIVLDMCYTNKNSKNFAWDVCGEQIIQNLLKRRNYTYQYPEQCDDGEFEFGGERFTMKTISLLPEIDAEEME